MLKSIYSSKLYIASSRKSRIHAAMSNPGNLSLVQQLASDLDDEYKTSQNLGKEEKPAESQTEENNSLFVDEEINPETDLMTVNDMKGEGGFSGGVHHSSSPAPKEPESNDSLDLDKPESNTDELIPESPANEKPAKEEQPTEASTKIVSTTIVKPEQLVNIDTLKGSLNARADLAGVLRVAVKEKEQEIWIYYNDNVNLNNIMVDVIEFVKNAGYDVLEFNRLARSDNAIVFSISFRTITKPDKSIEEAAEEKKE